MIDSKPLFQIEWGGPEFGWIDFSILGEHPFALPAGIYDPFPEMVAWVKRCCLERGTQTFTWNDEAMDHVFLYQTSHRQLSILQPCYEAPPKLEWQGVVTLEELHDSFYRKFFAFCDSPDFNESHWAGMSARVLFERFSDGHPEIFIERLLEADSNSLNYFGAWLWDYCIDCGNGDGYRAAMAREDFLRTCWPPAEERWKLHYELRPCDFKFGVEWDGATPERRQELLAPLLDERHGHTEAAPPASYRDPELDAWKPLH